MSTVSMSSQFIRQGTMFLVRRPFSRALKTHPRQLRPRFESQHFYEILAARPQYYVGKIKNVQVENMPEAVQTFLDASPYGLDGSLFAGIGREASAFQSTTVMALLLKIRSLMTTGDASAVMHLGSKTVEALSRRAEELIEAEQSLQLEFTLADLFYRVNHSRSFNKCMLPRQASAIKYLTETDFLQHLFFSHSVRSLEPDTRTAVPIFIENVIDRLDLEEVALICFACFNCQYRLPRDEHWMKIVDAFDKHEGPVPDVVMGVLAKYLRFLNPVRREECRAMKKFLEVASRRQSEWSLSTHLRLANAGTQAQVCNEEIVRTAVPKLMKQLDTCRIKDLAVCLYSYGYFDFELDPRDAGAIIGRLRNENVLPKFHQWLVKATLSLAIMGYYDEQLLIKSLDRNVINFNTTHDQVWFDVYALFTVCNIMFPDLLGDKIPMTKKDMQIAIEKIALLKDCSRRYAIDLKDVQTLLEDEFHVETRLVQTLDAFPQSDIHIGENIVIVLHTKRFYSEEGGLRGLRRFRTTLLKATNYNVVELHQDFFEMKRSQQARHLQNLLANYLTK